MGSERHVQGRKGLKSGLSTQLYKPGFGVFFEIFLGISDPVRVYELFEIHVCVLA
jgi:hypothetical protein